MSISINNQSSTTLIIYYSKKLSNCHQIVNNSAQNRSLPQKQPVSLLFFGESGLECVPHRHPTIQTVFRSGSTIGIGYLRENSAHGKIRESLLGSARVSICPSVSNLCTFVLENQQAGIYDPTTELELIRFSPLPLEELVWHLITQVNGGDLDAQITVFEPRRGKRRRFTPFMFYSLVYPSIASNLVTMATLSPWSDYVCTHTCYPFLRKYILR